MGLPKAGLLGQSDIHTAIIKLLSGTAVEQVCKQFQVSIEPGEVPKARNGT